MFFAYWVTYRGTGRPDYSVVSAEHPETDAMLSYNGNYQLARGQFSTEQEAQEALNEMVYDDENGWLEFVPTWATVAEMEERTRLAIEAREMRRTAEHTQWLVDEGHVEEEDLTPYFQNMLNLLKTQKLEFDDD